MIKESKSTKDEVLKKKKNEKKFGIAEFSPSLCLMRKINGQ